MFIIEPSSIKGEDSLPKMANLVVAESNIEGGLIGV
jgi:hypothetical protein